MLTAWPISDSWLNHFQRLLCSGKMKRGVSMLFKQKVLSVFTLTSLSLDFLLADFNSTTFSLNPNPNYHEKTGKNWVADSCFRNLLEAILFRVQEEEVLLSVPKGVVNTRRYRPCSPFHNKKDYRRIPLSQQTRWIRMISTNYEVYRGSSQCALAIARQTVLDT
jgi:hypothetical protein